LQDIAQSILGGEVLGGRYYGEDDAGNINKMGDLSTISGGADSFS
jgi:hypothetical protein